MEISIITEEISNILKNRSGASNINILEFGCGDGFQIPYLKRLGKVIASDTYTSAGIKSLQDIEFVETGITNTPFDDGQKWTPKTGQCLRSNFCLNLNA